MDIKAAFKQEMMRQKKEAAPRTVLMRVEKEPAFSATNPNVFQVVGTVVGTNEIVAVVTVKGSENQIVPKVGDILRADKAERDAARPNVQAYKAKYFHTYEQSGLCIKALMQPLPIKSANNLVSAQVMAHDPSKGGVMITGDRLKDELIGSIVKQLKPWTHTEQSAITHDVAGKSVWGLGTTRGLTPVVTVRVQDQAFLIWGIGSKNIDPNDPSKGTRLPTDAEIQASVLANPRLKNLTAVFTNLGKQEGVTKEMLSQVDVALLPGLAISVGTDMVTSAVRKKIDYFPVPEAYAVPGADRPGLRESYIHVKPTRTHKVAVVDTNPAPGQKLGKLPLFAVEKERAEFRNGGSATAAASSAQAAQIQGRPVNRAEALDSAADEFADSPLPNAVQSQPVQAQAPQQAVAAQPQPTQQAQQHAKVEEAPVVAAAAPVAATVGYVDQEHDEFYGDFGDDDFEEQLASDMAAMEMLGQGLDMSVDTMLMEAEEMSASRRAPKFG